MRVRVLLFAAFRELFAQREIEVDLPVGATAEDLFVTLQQRQPALARLRPYTSFAVNREMQTSDVRLHSGDEVALLQPVSGGST